MKVEASGTRGNGTYPFKLLKFCKKTANYCLKLTLAHNNALVYIKVKPTSSTVLCVKLELRTIYFILRMLLLLYQ